MKKRNMAILAGGVLLLVALIILWIVFGGTSKVVLCLQNSQGPLRQELESVLSQSDYAVAVARSTDQASQLEAVAKAAKGKCAALVVELYMSEAATEVVSIAQAADVPVIFVGKAPDGAVLSSWEKAFYVGTDAAAYGNAMAELAQKGDVNGDGVVSYAVVAGPEDSDETKLQLQGCSETLGEGGELLCVEHTRFEEEEGEQKTASVLARYGKDVEVLFCGSDSLAAGALSAIKAAGRTVGENLYVIAAGEEEMEGLSGAVLPDFKTISEKTAVLLSELTANAVTETAYRVQPRRITASK